ncbi:DUF4230 domain-containing protein [Xylanibacter muris]|uniref:DUF4230 domain-containing protein n=1 Tax=Xylanibacter muris TaxID=2736290 RepID=A0ABX2APQ4_9BACT|nr:DUF4230 domain-containing protein [Xylanibacter muris]NPD92953.1 DUF4230 domain-containing protein [Xylanibacter muris]
MKILNYIIIYIFITGTLIPIACSDKKDDGKSTHVSETDTLPMLIMQIQKCSRLYTTEYNIHKIITHDDVIRMQGKVLNKDFNIKLPVGDRKIAIPMTATLKAYIDFSDFSDKNVERDGKNITIILPDPQIVMTSSRINQKEIKEYVSITRSYFTDAEITEFEKQGKEAIIARINDTNIIETARDNAARVLIPMIEQMGYDEKNITIKFRKDIKKLNVNVEK